MLPISVCIIGKNEEKYLDDCLKSLVTYDWEIVFVDTGSTDKTRDIALKYTDNVYDFAWIKDFSAARNFAASKATRDWILAVDCDEFLEPFDVNALLKMLKDYPDSSAFINQCNLTDDLVNYTRSEVYRFYPKKYFHWVNTIHEQLVRLDGNPATSFHSGISVMHYGYIEGKTSLKEKNERNLELLLKIIEKEPDNPYHYFQAGISYMNLLDYENAVTYLTKATEYDVNPELPWVQELIYYYGITLINAGLADVALGLEGIYEEFKNVPEYIYMMGLVYAANGKFAQSLSMLTKVVTMEEECHIAAGITSYVGYFQLGNVCHHLKKDELAKIYLKKAGDYTPALNLLKSLT